MNHPILHFAAIELRGLMRNKDVLFGTFVFPLILATVLGVAFRNNVDDHPVLPVAVLDEAPDLLAMVAAHPYLKALSLNQEDAERAVRAGEALLLVRYAGDGLTRKPTIIFDPQRNHARYAAALVDEAIQRAGGRTNVADVAQVAVMEKGNRYIDFLFPGLLSLILLSVSLGHISNMVVQQRARGLLRIYAVTPLRKSHYFLSWVLSQIILHTCLLAYFLAAGVLLFGIVIRGSLLEIWALGTFGAFCFGMIGVAIAARSHRVEFVGFLSSMTTLPMYLLSGVFFSSANYPQILQPLIKILPLTPFVTAMRAMIIDGASLAQFAPNLIILSAWGVVGMIVSVRLFRFF